MNDVDCSIIRDRLLEANVEELHGKGESDLARHVATCAECRAHARRMLAGYASLERGLGILTRSRRRSWVWWAPLPLAAAAVLALLLTQQSQQTVIPPTQLAQLMFQDEPIVSPPPGKHALVMEKNDLTVLWLY